jgi:hypothetical protein
VGDWELVLPTPSSSTPREEESGASGKRVLQTAQTEEYAAAESSRNYRVGERRIGAGLEEIWESDAPIRLKVKSEQQQRSQAQLGMELETKPKVEIDYGLPKATEMPVWKAQGWSKPGEVKEEVKEEIREEAMTDNSTPATADTIPRPPSAPTEPSVKNEPEEPKLDESTPASGGGSSLFRKRKAPPSTAGTRGTKKR